jgi:lysine 6-dehydrogenase
MATQGIRKVAVLGAGMMGFAAAYELMHFEPYFGVVVCDSDPAKLSRIKEQMPAVTTLELELSEPETYIRQFNGIKGIFSALPYYLNPGAARLAVAIGAHFVDLGGNTQAVDEVFSLGNQARVRSLSLLPDAGLAPGLVNVLAAHSLELLPTARSVQIRVGGIPMEPKPPLDYALCFSVDGLINEYREPCRVLSDGLIIVVPPISDLEQISFPPDFPLLEAFNTSGGSSTLPLTYARKLDNLNYKTIRYPGHAAKIKTLLDLGLMDSEEITLQSGAKVSPVEVLTELLQKNLPQNEPDVVLLRVTANDDQREVVLEMIDYSDSLSGLSAMMRTTAFPATCILREQISGNIPAGVWRLEEVVNSEKLLRELARRSINISVKVGKRR